MLITVEDNNGNKKDVVRGYNNCEYHGKKHRKVFLCLSFMPRHPFHPPRVYLLDDVFQRAAQSIEALGLESQVQGGGRIRHVPGKEVFVYGYSMVRFSPIRSPLALRYGQPAKRCTSAPPRKTSDLCTGFSVPVRRLAGRTTMSLWHC